MNLSSPMIIHLAALRALSLSNIERLAKFFINLCKNSSDLSLFLTVLLIRMKSLKLASVLLAICFDVAFGAG